MFMPYVYTYNLRTFLWCTTNTVYVYLFICIIYPAVHIPCMRYSVDMRSSQGKGKCVVGGTHTSSKVDIYVSRVCRCLYRTEGEVNLPTVQQKCFICLAFPCFGHAFVFVSEPTHPPTHPASRSMWLCLPVVQPIPVRDESAAGGGRCGLAAAAGG